MAQTKYTYSIATDTANNLLAVGALRKEIQDSSIVTSYDHISTLGDVLDIYMKDALSAGDETLLTTLVNSHTGVPLANEAIQKVEVPIDKPVRQFALAEGSLLRARLVGIINQSIVKSTTTDIDWQIPNLQYGSPAVSKQTYMDGIQYKASKGVDGDKMTLQVVDKDGLYYPAGTVLDEFGKDWAVFPENEVMIRLYKAKLVPGLYLRLKYTSTGTVDDVYLVCNLFRHMDTGVNL